MSQTIKNLPAYTGNVGDMGLIPGSGRSPGGGNGNSFPYAWLEKPKNRGTWWAAVHGVSKSQIQLSSWARAGSLHTYTHTISLFYTSLIGPLIPCTHLIPSCLMTWHIHRFWSLKLGHSGDHYSVYHPPLLSHYLTYSPISILYPVVCFIVFIIT